MCLGLVLFPSLLKMECKTKLLKISSFLISFGTSRSSKSVPPLESLCLVDLCKITESACLFFNKLSKEDWFRQIKKSKPESYSRSKHKKEGGTQHVCNPLLVETELQTEFWTRWKISGLLQADSYLLSQVRSQSSRKDSQKPPLHY